MRRKLLKRNVNTQIYCKAEVKASLVKSKNVPDLFSYVLNDQLADFLRWNHLHLL